MMSNPWKLALRFAFSRQGPARWRRWSVIASSVLAAFLAMMAAGTLSAAHHVDIRRDLRMPEWSASSDEAGFLASAGISQLHNKQFTVLWVEPGPEFSDSIVPPGLARFPGPGEAAVSSALAREGITAKALGFDPAATTSGRHGVIGDDGVPSADEYFVYIRPAPGTSLGDPEQLLPFSGYAQTPDTGWAGTEWFDLDAPYPVAAALAPMVLLMLLVPALFVMGTGLRMHSAHREERLRILAELGLPDRKLRRLQQRENLVLVIPGALVGALLWQSLAAGGVQFPGTPAAAYRAEAMAPWWTVSGWLLICIGVVMMASVLEAMRSRRRRNALEPERTAAWAVGVLAVDVIALCILCLPTVSARFPEEERSVLFMLLAAGAVMLLPFVIPWLVRRAAHRLRRRGEGQRTSLAIARIEHAPVTVSRGAVMLAAMIVLGMFATSLLAARAASAEESHASRVVSLVWMDEQRSTQESVVRALSDQGMTVLPLGTSDSGREVVEVDACTPGVSRILGLATADCGALLEAKDPSAHASALGYTGPIPVKEAARHTTSALLDVPGTVQEADLYRLVGRYAAGMQVTGMWEGPVHHYLLRWYSFLLIVGVLALWLGLCRDMADRAVRAVDERATLFRIGIPDSAIWRTIRSEIAVPCVVAFLLSLGIGVVMSAFGQGLGLTMLTLRDAAGVALFGAGSALAVAWVATAVVRRSGHRTLEAGRGTGRGTR